MEVRKATMTAFHQATLQQMDEVPSPRRRGRTARRIASSVGLGLERNFQTKVSMTPPARLPSSVNFNESPFADNHQRTTSIEFPATEAKRQALPRSQAFGPFSPLNSPSMHMATISTHATDRNIDGSAASSSTGLGDLRRTVALHGQLHSHAQSSASPSLPVQHEDTSPASLAESFALPRQSRTDSSKPPPGDFVAQPPRRRRMATTPVRQMRTSHTENNSSSPSSPTRAANWSSVIVEADVDRSEDEGYATESEAGSDNEINTLRPGASSFVCRRMSGIRSISVSHSRQQSHPISTLAISGSRAEPMQRSATTSSIQEPLSSRSSSASIVADACMTRSSAIADSPFKTPNKRRARAQGSSSSSLRGRSFATQSPVAAPADSEEGTLFGSASSSSIGRTDQLDYTDEASVVMSGGKDFKRRSIGSLSHWQQDGAGKTMSAKKSMPTFVASARRTSLAGIPSRLSSGSEVDQPCSDTPNRFAYDDSGVALQSPNSAQGKDKRNERFAVSTKHLALTALKQPDEVIASPSKLAASRRAASDYPAQQSHILFPGHGRTTSVRERSSLANEAHFSDGSSSTKSTPEVRRSFGSTFSVPEGLVSPPRNSAKSQARTSQSSSSLAVEGSTAPYLTPQNYKNVVPLQTAFMSTGLASKRSRPTMGTLDPITREPLPPLPAMLKYSGNGTVSVGGGSNNGNNLNDHGNISIGSNSGSVSSVGNSSFQSSGTMAASLGLRDIVAAANAHAAATAHTSIPSSMPDTPMKKPAASFNSNHHPLTTGPKGIPVRSKLGMSLSPGSMDGNESSSGGSAYGGDSPLLSQSCDSPTLSLTSFAGHALHRTSPISMLDAITRGHSESDHTNSHSSLISTSPSSPIKSSEMKRSLIRQSLPAQSRGGGNEESLRAQVMTRPLSLSRPPLGLQRKSSFGPASDQASILAVQSPLFDAVPSTPTRHSATIKWYEAAQLVSTPSPSHRRRASEARRESWQAYGSMRSKTARQGSGSIGAGSSGSGYAPPPTRMLTGSSSSHHLRGGARPSYYAARFTVHGTLGKGEFSQVDKAEDKQDGCLYAVKRMKRAYAGPRDRLRRLEEVDILRLLGSEGGHPNIVAYVDAWEEAGHLFVQTELCPCVDFSSFLQHFSNMGGSLDEARLWKVMRELSEGLGFIHDMHVLHLDLKPANIFITDIATLKIGDFGLATRWPPVEAATILAGAGMDDDDDEDSGREGGGDSSTIRGTIGAFAGGANIRTSQKSRNVEREGDREYIAPEILLHGSYSKAADVYSLGLVMLEAAGDVILPDNGEPWQKLRNDDLSDVDLSQFSISLIRLIRQCLCANSDSRPTVDALRQHPVLQAVGKRCALGVEMSELDQLPAFDIANSESCQSFKAVARSSAAANHEDKTSTDTEMTVDGDEDLVPYTPRPFPSTPVCGGITAGAAVPITASSAAMERTASAKSALGLEGVEDDDKVLDFRGALIYENLDFLLSILEAEPDPEARLTMTVASQPSESRQGAPHVSAHAIDAIFNVPTINVDMDDSGDVYVEERSDRASYAPIRRSPLSQATHDSIEMDIDA